MASYYLLLSLLLFPFLLFLKIISTSPKHRYRLPPGPWTIPIIGSIHHLIGAGHPHYALRDLSRKYGDLMYLQLGEIPSVVVSSKEAAREVLKTHDLAFSTRFAHSTVKILFYDGKDMGFAPYGEHWRELRKICVLELLSSKQVQSFRSVRDEEVRSMIQWISNSASSSGGIVNLSEGLLVMINNVVLRAIMGNKFKDQKKALNDVLKVFDLITGFNLANLFPSSGIVNMISGTKQKAKECHWTLDQLLDSIIQEHRTRESDGEVEDLLRVLLKLYDENSENNLLTPDIIKAVILDLITAGTDTTTVTLDWTIAELMKNPEVMQKAQTEVRQQLQGRDYITESDLAKLNFLHLVIKETMRLHPPGPLLPRECREACKIFGYNIPKGACVLVNLWALGRDSKHWKDADDFKPDRFADMNSDVSLNALEFIPFGAGRRSCPGMSFGLAILELALANLLYHFNWELPCGMKPDELDMTETFGFTTRKKIPLLLQAQRYIALT
ncbi:cytochrome P450 family 71 polypeptide [Rhynchospora pubera]|uniref:Cytochrome P450 family 71 polypeptide n=1 Tax=Rhynchospora pubera TaxID=906938 RepID=A0AAV8DU75_9POAL|nr:cytochrome P450 family 71 polypeptide [Rhynchospora pubera]KAJ4779293.1 cytochrome P450 family 71 polypeptide [Rhynchospora pubera]